MLRGSNAALRQEATDSPGDSTCDLDAVVRTIIEAVQGPAFIACTDGTVLYANAAGRRMLAASRSLVTANLARAIEQRDDTRDDPAWEVKQVPGAAYHHLVIHHAKSNVSSRVGAAVTRWELSRRQAEVLALVIEGHPNASIATILGIATRTVEVHVSALLERLHVENRSALVSRVLGA